LRESKSRLYQLAHHDTLTGLPNRLLFRDRLERAIAKAERNQSLVAILFLDLDRFKYINDTLGHDIGDEVLREVAARLQGQCRKSDTVARLGGDELIFMLDDITTPNVVASVAEKILDAMAVPLSIEGQELSISTSIGIGIYPNDSKEIDFVIKCADMALYQAKSEGRNTYRFYRPEMNSDIIQISLLESQLPSAIHKQEFLIEYQPQYELLSGKLVGLEALLRWNHPDHGLIQPNDFLPVAEESGLIVPIGEWVLQEVCDQIIAWQLADLNLVPVTVNVALQQLQDVNFLPFLAQLIKEGNLPPELLEIEIGESLVTRELEETISSMDELSRFGIRLAVDDFGTISSSLAYLQRFSVDRLKIDRSIIRNVPKERNTAKIVSLIILMGYGLGITVLAEGVENEEQLNFLKEYNCEQVQGFFLARPTRAQHIEKLLKPKK
jgi:diguanylate cyclase (GGDEF)-like protein